jgi:hypothetical protein
MLIGASTRGILALILVDGCAAVVIGEKFLNLPYIRFCADGELEVFPSDGVPELKE